MKTVVVKEEEAMQIDGAATAEEAILQPKDAHGEGEQSGKKEGKKCGQHMNGFVFDCVIFCCLNINKKFEPEDQIHDKKLRKTICQKLAAELENVNCRFRGCLTA